MMVRRSALCGAPLSRRPAPQNRLPPPCVSVTITSRAAGRRGLVLTPAPCYGLSPHNRETAVSIIEQIATSIIDCNEQATASLVAEALAQQLPARQILEDGLLKGMSEVGRRFRDGEYFVPEVLIAAEAMKAGTALLRPHLISQGVKPAATAVIGTVKGDLHDIGKNLVGTMLEGAGFEVIDLGVDVPAERFVETCRQRPVQLIGLSALLTTTMPMMADIVKAVHDGLATPPVILVGGAPVTEAYAKEIGADGYGRDAATGAELAKRLCLRKAS